MSLQFERVAIIGIGLIGSSLAHVIRREKIANHIAGYAKSAETRKTAQQLGLVDSMHETAAATVKGADLVILCVPVGACGEIAREIGAGLKPGCIVTDVGSEGCCRSRCWSSYSAGRSFYSRPSIAGTEQSGPASGFADLFVKRWCIHATSRQQRFGRHAAKNSALAAPRWS
jgi:cyclohexadieny/prephenate dehydrogenase